MWRTTAAHWWSIRRFRAGIAYSNWLTNEISVYCFLSFVEIGEILPLASGGQCNVTQREKCQHYSSPDTHFDFSSCTNGKPISEMTWERSKTLGCILKASMKIGLRCRRNRLGQQTTNGNARFWETGEAIVRKRFWETGEVILRENEKQVRPSYHHQS